MAKTTSKITVALASLLMSAGVAAIPPIYGLQTGLENEDIGDNSENIFYVAGSALFSHGLSRNSIVELFAELGASNFSDNSDQSGEIIILEGVYSYTPRAGFQVPTYSLGLRYFDESASSSLFDETKTSLLAYLSYPLDDRIDLRGGVKLDDREAQDDSTITNYFIEADYRLNPKWILYTSLNLADEEIDLGEADPNAGAGSFDTFARSFIGSGHLPSEGGGQAGSIGGTSIDSDNTFIALGASYALSPFDTLDFSLISREYDTDNGTIDGNEFNAYYFHRF